MAWPFYFLPQHNQAKQYHCHKTQKKQSHQARKNKRIPSHGGFSSLNSKMICAIRTKTKPAKKIFATAFVFQAFQQVQTKLAHLTLSHHQLIQRQNLFAKSKAFPSNIQKHANQIPAIHLLHVNSAGLFFPAYCYFNSLLRLCLN